MFYNRQELIPRSLIVKGGEGQSLRFIETDVHRDVKDSAAHRVAYDGTIPVLGIKSQLSVWHLQLQESLAEFSPEGNLVLKRFIGEESDRLDRDLRDLLPIKDGTGLTAAEVLLLIAEFDEYERQRRTAHIPERTISGKESEMTHFLLETPTGTKRARLEMSDWYGKWFLDWRENSEAPRWKAVCAGHRLLIKE